MRNDDLPAPIEPGPKRNVLWIGLFAVLVLSLAIPHLMVNEAPLLDYPNHLARTFILNHLHDPNFQFSKYYRADWKPYPYILWDILLITFQQVLPIELAGKSMLMLETMLLPVAVAWFLWQANRTEIKLSLLACALSYYTLFLWGFVAYQLSIGLCFLMIGTWLWYRRKPSAVRAVLFAVICFATYFAHVFGFASAAFILVFYEGSQFNWREALRLACFLAPPSALALWARPGISGASALEWQSISQRLLSPVGVLIHGYNRKLDHLSFAGFVLCLLFAVVGNRELRVNKRWLITTLGLFGVYMLLPYAWGETYDVNTRVVPPLYLSTLAVLRVGRRANWIAVVAVLLTALRVFNIATGFQREAQGNAAMNRGIESMARDSRVLPIMACGESDSLQGSYGFYWAYAVIRRGDTSGGLYDIPGQTAMRTTYEPFNRDFEGKQIDWKSVSGGYDYVWSYGDIACLAGGSGIGGVADVAYQEGPLTIYKLRK